MLTSNGLDYQFETLDVDDLHDVAGYQFASRGPHGPPGTL
jgi:hypothetical protein